MWQVGKEDMISEQLLTSTGFLSCEPLSNEAHTGGRHPEWGDCCKAFSLCRVDLQDSSELPAGPRALCCPSASRWHTQLLSREGQIMEPTPEALTGLFSAVSHSSETDPKRHKVQTHRNTWKQPYGSGPASHPDPQTEALLGGDT